MDGKRIRYGNSIMIRVYCKNTGTFADVAEGTSLLEIKDVFKLENSDEIISARVNNVSEGLRFKVFNTREVEFLDYSTYLGRSVYCRSLCFLMIKAAKDVMPGCRLKIRRPISKGYFCFVEKEDGSALTADDIALLKSRMKELADADLSFRRHEVPTAEAIDLFGALGRKDVVRLLRTSGQIFTLYYSLDGFSEYFYDTLVPSTGYLKVWDLVPYEEGMILRVPDRHNPAQLAPFNDQPKTFGVFRENIRWNNIMGLENVGDVNDACQKGQASELIQVAEALQEKKIVQFAEEIEKRYRENGVRIVLITGPSSSGKTTVTKRLSVQLKACGLRPVSFSTDDYFVNRVDTPLLPDGSYDFDNFETVDHRALEQDVLKLLAGEEVQVPEYNFVTGIREYNGKTLKLESGNILIIEGIHALNTALIPSVSRDRQYKIFINTVTSIALDDHNSIPTSDNRLLRRIVRDYNKGAFTAVETIRNWPNVRRSEVKWIYPYQETADALFNSAYLVEFAVLRSHAEQILRTIPKNCPEYSEAYRLLKFLHFFTPVSDKEIPPTSLLREFVGGSSFKY